MPHTSKPGTISPSGGHAQKNPPAMAMSDPVKMTSTTLRFNQSVTQHLLGLSRIISWLIPTCQTAALAKPIVILFGCTGASKCGNT